MIGRAIGILLTVWVGVSVAFAEPYLAVRSGLNCSSCHVNRTGGGGRSAFGAGYGAQSVPWSRLSTDGIFDGVLHERVRVGADLRAAYTGTAQAQGAYVGAFEVGEANLYLTFDLLPERVILYVDERFAPGGAASREAFGMVTLPRGGLYAKAGRFFLPYGLRLQDDEAATRRPLGFTFDNGDVGIEVGGKSESWSWAVAATNGTDGGSEVDNGKQFTATGGIVRQRWRLMASGATNDLAGNAKRDLAGLWGGAQLGPVGLLAAYDKVWDTDDVGARTTGDAAHVEIDATPHRGLTFRVWVGRSQDEDREVRQLGWSADWTPWPGLQLRLLARRRDGYPESPSSGDDQVSAELHLYF